ncbi:hypothetical protein [Streptomyces sp. 4N124]|uniref:hypothetical protein n=1 Tax=Streptomyces sp. 4N124 TaxID=3457420 RepID=UPI003FD234BC
MGSNLRRQLREALPPSIKGLQRAVALEIADDARYDDDWNYSPEKGRRSRVRLAELVRWTAAKDELSVREMLRRLSLAGWEFRLPIGKDKNGNLLYAVPGKAMTFRVPDFEGPTTVGPEVEIEAEGPTVVGPKTHEGPTAGGQGPTVVAQGPTTVGAGPTVVGAGPTTVGPPSPVSSFSTKESPSSSPVAEDSPEGSVHLTDGTDGGGGGNLSLEEITKQAERAQAFVDSLDYRNRQPGKKQRQQLGTLVVAAFKSGWTENGLRRYLDISDDPNVRSAAAVYVHRLSDDELPQAVDATLLPPVCDRHLDPAAATDPALRVHPITGDPCSYCHPAALLLPPACETCLQYNPGAATDARLRIDVMSFQGGPCPNCHPASVGKGPAELPPVCPACLEANPAAEFNPKFRYRQGDHGMAACDDCHPKRLVILASHKSRQQQETDGWTDRAMARARQRMQTGDWKGAGTDERSAGWMVLAQDLSAEERINRGPKPMIAPPRRQPYRDPEDQSVYDEPFWPEEK